MTDTPLDLKIDTTGKKERRLRLDLGDGEWFEAVAHRDTFESTWTSGLNQPSFVDETCEYVARGGLEVFFVTDSGPKRVRSDQLKEASRANPSSSWIRINDVSESLTWIAPVGKDTALCNLIGSGYDRWHMQVILERTASLELREQVDLLMAALDRFPGQSVERDAHEGAATETSKP